jgi:hypothetical protein
VLSLAAAGVAAAQAVPETHTVRPGDTLWGLAQQYLGDPLLWPDIYRQNTLVVEDPHWIYPGEVLRLSGATTGAVSPGPEAAAPAQEAAAPEAAAAVTPEAAPEAAAPAEQPAESVQVAQVEEPQVEEPPYLPPEEPSDTTGALFPTSMGHPNWADIRLNFRESYRPLTKSMFYSAGWLTEGQKLPLGDILGYVTPIQIRSATEDRRNAQLYTKLAVKPPSGATYQVGDTLLMVLVETDNIRHYGRIVHPLGLARITEVTGKQTAMEVIAQYQAVRPGQHVMPIEKFPEFASTRAVPISDGLQGSIIAARDRTEMVSPQNIVFIDKGKKAGVALGDIFEARREPNVAGASDAVIPEVLAVFQVVHVGEETASLQATQVNTPYIPLGTRVRQIAKLPT